ncbi:MAG: NlpC/P60 family protein [Eubacteriales bacterium]
MEKEKRLNTAKFTQRIILPALVILVAIAVVTIFLFRAAKVAEYNNPLDQTKINEAIARNEGLSVKRQALVDAAVSLVGKVNYFWGGKSDAIGWDDEWGTLKEVDSQGSDTTGSMRPYGLDCSGYISWCYIQLGMSFREMEEKVGNGSTNQWKKSFEIELSEVEPGDLIFQYEPNSSDGNHVGICIGFNENGDPLIAHCSAQFDNVVVTTRGVIFNYARRLSFLD